MMRSVDRVRVLASRVCSPGAMERRIEPALADWRNEYLDACQQGRHWRCRWVQCAGLLTVVKVITLIALEHGALMLVRPDPDTRAALLKAGAVFGIVTAVAAAVLAWVPLNAMPVARPFDVYDLLLLIPQALPIAIPIGLTAAIVLALDPRLASRVVVPALAVAVLCAVVSFLTLGWGAPASNQVYRTKVLGFEIAKGDNELSLGEIGTRIDEIRAFDPIAPARRLSTLYHMRVALSGTPIVLAVFGLAMIGRVRPSRVLRAVTAVLACGGFTFLLVWTSYLAFRGVVAPPVAAWLPNIVFIGLAGIASLPPSRPVSHAAR